MSSDDVVKKVDGKIQEQEPGFDKFLDKLKGNPHSLRLVIIYSSVLLLAVFILGRCSV